MSLLEKAEMAGQWRKRQCKTMRQDPGIESMLNVITRWVS